MQYIGIDPSFSNTGVAYLDLDRKILKLLKIKPAGTNETYKDALERSASIALAILQNTNIKNEMRLIIEEPLVTSMKASRLGILSGVISFALSTIPTVTTMYSINPKHISALNKPIADRLGIDKKKASLHVANKIINYLQSRGFDVIIINEKFNKRGGMKVRALTHDEAEALILLTIMLQEENLVDQNFLLNLVSINRGFAKQSSITKIKETKNKN